MFSKLILWLNRLVYALSDRRSFSHISRWCALLLHKHCCIYCKFWNFRENFIFAKSIKRHICDVKNSRLGHDLPTSVKDIVISPFRDDSIFTKLRICEVRENKTIGKISKFTVAKTAKHLQGGDHCRNCMMLWFVMIQPWFVYCITTTNPCRRLHVSLPLIQEGLMSVTSESIARSTGHEKSVVRWTDRPDMTIAVIGDVIKPN